MKMKTKIVEIQDGFQFDLTIRPMDEIEMLQNLQQQGYSVLPQVAEILPPPEDEGECQVIITTGQSIQALLELQRENYWMPVSAKNVSLIRLALSRDELKQRGISRLLMGNGE